MKAWKTIGPIIVIVMLVGSLLGTACSNEGSQGEAGVGIESAVDNLDGTFTLNFTDGNSFTTSDLTGPQGTAGGAMAWQGTWVVSTSYSVNDAVEDDGSSYICIQEHTSSAGDEPGVGGSWETYWDLFAQSGYSEDISQIIDDISILQDTADDIKNDLATLQDTADDIKDDVAALPMIETHTGGATLTSNAWDHVLTTRNYSEIRHVSLTLSYSGLTQPDNDVWVTANVGGVEQRIATWAHYLSSPNAGTNTIEFNTDHWEIHVTRTGSNTTVLYNAVTTFLQSP